MADRTAINLSLTEGALELCEQLMLKLGIARSAVIELAVREYAVRVVGSSKALASIVPLAAASDR
jgi:hypothetical protein